MNVIRGTFRLSILVGLASLGVLWWQTQNEAHKAAGGSYELWSTVRCAGYLLESDTKPMENDFGNIDLSKHTSCSTRPFWTNRQEIADALKSESPYQARYAEEMKWRRHQIWQGALAMFLLTNLLGLAFLGLRAAYRWVWSGYRP